MAKGCLAIRLPPWACADAAELLLKIAFGIHAARGKVCGMGKKKKFAFLHAKIPVNNKMVDVSMGVRNFDKKKKPRTPSLYLRTSLSFMGKAQACVRAVLDEVISESLVYAVDTGADTVRWHMGNRAGDVAEVFDIVRSVPIDNLAEEHLHIFDFQHEGQGTVLRPFDFFFWGASSPTSQEKFFAKGTRRENILLVLHSSNKTGLNAMLSSRIPYFYTILMKSHILDSICMEQVSIPSLLEHISGNFIYLIIRVNIVKSISWERTCCNPALTNLISISRRDSSRMNLISCQCFEYQLQQIILKGHSLKFIFSEGSTLEVSRNSL